MNCGAEIECIMPNGEAARVALRGQAEGGAGVLIGEDDTVSYRLPEGDTYFVISLPQPSLLDRMTFVNENAAARGELRIAVSGQELPAQSDRWTPVDGSIRFDHKRLFNVSMLGVEARFVRLTFSVKREGNIGGLGLYSARPAGANQRQVVNNDRNVANSDASARVVYVSSGQLNEAGRMIGQ